MHIAQLDRQITIQAYTKTPDATGGTSKSYTDTATVWAKVEFAGGKEDYQADERVAEGLAFFIIRYRTDVQERDRIVFESENYEIEVIEEVTRKKYLRIKARRKDNG